MNGNLLSYSGIVTKVKTMGSNLISMEDYNFISTITNVPDFINFLKKQPSYHDLFDNLDEKSLHRGQIERIIINAVYKDFAKIYRFSDQHQRNILKLIFFRYEVNILKGCLLRVFNQDNTYNLASFYDFFTSHSKLKIDALVASRSMEEFILNLKGSIYHTFFTTLYHSNHHTLFDYEMQLDIFYYKTVWRLKDKYLKGSELKIFSDCLGKQIDLQNIMWIYRSKKFYDVDNSTILSIIIPISYKLKKDQLADLIETGTIEEFLNYLSSTYYHSINDLIEEQSIELIFRKLMSTIYKYNSKKNPSSISPILNYLFLKEQEIDKLTTALECIRYQLEPKEILAYVL